VLGANESTCRRVGDPSGEDETDNFFGVSHFPCCITNFPQGWPKFAMHAILVEETANPPAAVVASLVPMAATLSTIGARLVTETQYPFSDKVVIKVQANASMQVKVRIPGWADRATVNGQLAQNGTFAVVQCPVGETTLSIDLKPEIRLEFGWGELGVPVSDAVKYSPSGGSVPSSKESDLDLNGGAELVGSRESGYQDLRSGASGQTTSATITHPLIGEGHYITSVNMSYRYTAGYNCLPDACESPPHFELVAADGITNVDLAILYTSPALDKFSYDHYTGYSPLQRVHVDGLRVPNSKLVVLKLKLINGKHNMQLQLDPVVGFDVSVQWSGEKGPDPPAPPSPWLQPPTDGLGVTRGALLFALHPTEHRKIVKSYDNLPVRARAVDYEIGTDETWNYGLLPARGFDFVSNSSVGWSPSFAFDDSGEHPFYIKATARQVKSWGYWHGSMITDVPPASPVLCSDDSCGDETIVKLVPFGSTNIRIGVFPWIHSDAQPVYL